MKKYCFVVAFFLLFVLFLSGCNRIGQTSQGFGKLSESEPVDITRISGTENLISVCKPAIVGILATSGRYQSIGTGVCVNKNSCILTNYHVVEDASVINLYLSNGKVANASLVWKDSSSDLAVLKSSDEIPYLPLAENDSYDSGDEVIAIGTPIDLAFKHSATKGIISATNRTISVDNDFGESTLYNLIQHDASINPGNSGGPLINMKGEVIGINTVKVTDAEGMGFAIPVDTFKPVIQKISANGEYSTAYMGVFGFDNQLKNIGRVEQGFYVQSVEKNSPAEKMGLKKGDVITRVDDKNINLARELKAFLYEHEVGDTVFVTVKTNVDERIVEIKLEKHPYC